MQAADLRLLIDETRVVRAGDDAVLAADALVGVHRHDAGLRVAMGGARRADRDARGVRALLAGHAHVAAVGGIAALAFDFVVLQLEQQTSHSLGELVRFVAGDSAVAAANALVLVEDHTIVRRTGLTDLAGAASAEGHEDQGASTGASEKFSPVDLFAHDVLQ